MQTVFLGDGAAWVWEVARANFPNALQVLDFWHASEYLAAIARLLEIPDSPAFTDTLVHLALHPSIASDSTTC